MNRVEQRIEKGEGVNTERSRERPRDTERERERERVGGIFTEAVLIWSVKAKQLVHPKF